ncbi:MAG: DUF5615 family PIN-like protein [Phycicoccus sp.]
MRLLVDANLSPAVADALRKAGHDVAHVMDLGLHTATDETIFVVATEERYVIVTADSDFPMMLASRGAAGPSVLLLRHVNDVRPPEQAALLVANLPDVAAALDTGAIVSLSPHRLAVRDLPLG